MINQDVFDSSDRPTILLQSTLLLPERLARSLEPSLDKLESVLVTIISTHPYPSGKMTYESSLVFFSEATISSPLTAKPWTAPGYFSTRSLSSNRGLRSCSNYYQSLLLFSISLHSKGEPFLREEEETYLVQLINRHHIVLLSSEDTDGNGVDVLQIGLNEERGVESNSDISLDW